MKIGILALQGAVQEHHEMLSFSNVEIIEVRYPHDLKNLSGIILGGGESTAIGKLLKKQNIYFPLQKAIKEGLPAWGTCAGAILLAKEGSEYSLQVGDFSVQRNGFGRQNASFSTFLEVKGISKKFEAIFIRAPRFLPLSLKKTAIKILATHQREPVFLEQENIWASTFHPELGADHAVHQAFIHFCKEKKNLKKF